MIKLTQNFEFISSISQNSKPTEWLGASSHIEPSVIRIRPGTTVLIYEWDCRRNKLPSQGTVILDKCDRWEAVRRTAIFSLKDFKHSHFLSQRHIITFKRLREWLPRWPRKREARIAQGIEAGKERAGIVWIPRLKSPLAQPRAALPQAVEGLLQYSLLLSEFFACSKVGSSRVITWWLVKP